MNNENFKGEELLRKGGAIGLAAAAVAVTSIFGLPHIGLIAVSKTCNNMIQNSNPSNLRDNAINCLEGQKKDKEDDFCSAIANEILTEFS